MTVPDYQTLMLPLLRSVADQQEHVVGEVVQELAVHFRLTPDERRQLLPSGRQAAFDNRVRWAKTYLTKAGLLETTGRGRFHITKRGLDVLSSPPDTINIGFLEQFPGFVEFRSASRKVESEDVAELETPEELLEVSYQNLRASLAQELLEQVKKCSPQFFEHLVVDLLVAMGYGGSRKDAGQAVGQSGDGGVDGIIKEDKLGLDIVYIQAKRWEGAVGRPIVQAFAGSLEGQRARKGVLITTSQFTADAKDYVNRIEKKIILIDGEQLAQLMIDYDVGVADYAAYHVKKVDLDYFGDGP
jgi:restriction system protein